MEQLIQSSDELYEYFRNCYNSSRKQEKLYDGAYISSKIRKEVLISTNQGKIVLGGKFYTIIYYNMTGSVYRAYINLSKR